MIYITPKENKSSNPPRQDLVLMEETPHRVSRRTNGGTHCQNDAEDVESRRQQRHHFHGDDIKCSGKRCRSTWAAAAIADCVALCCCPCAIINFLTLTFVKVPWMIGRRCLGGGGKNKKKKKKKKRRLNTTRQGMSCRELNGEGDVFETADGDEKCGGIGVGCCGGGGGYDDHRFVVERDGSLTKEEGDDGESRISARVEAERVWLELYQIGHLGFGRVSFTGIQ
ncbi:unnamed protein product [Eruca vesicaria subsp. sativa]|uniref:Transmembrane protein n=1 Tax=Eruca vesicaria subsp. sativa TaxID=29727 RepID=A0ABC8JHG4_ERUVS|nr:unnamed protein product [Eruca vesicaria subsp. sativa]